MKNQDVNQTFWEHLDVLRGALIRVASIAAIVSVVAFCFKEALFQVVLAPKQNDFITYEWLNRIAVGMGAAPTSFSIDLINTSLAQQFLIHMKTALFAGLLGASPYALYQLIRFITPALYTEERKPVYRVIGWGYTLFLVGLLIGYFLIFPLTFRFLGDLSGEYRGRESDLARLLHRYDDGDVFGVGIDLRAADPLLAPRTIRSADPRSDAPFPPACDRRHPPDCCPDHTDLRPLYAHDREPSDVVAL